MPYFKKNIFFIELEQLCVISLVNLEYFASQLEFSFIMFCILSMFQKVLKRCSDNAMPWGIVTEDKLG